MHLSLRSVAVLFLLALAACDSSVEDDGEGGNGGASITSASSTKAATSSSTSSTATQTGVSQSSTGASMLNECPAATVTIEYTSGDNASTESCKTVETLDPANYEVFGDPDAYRTAFEAMAAGEAIDLSIRFRTAINSDAGYRFASVGESGGMLATTSQCDQAPVMQVQTRSKATDAATLTACAAETDVPAQIACIREAFVAAAGDPHCGFPEP